MFYPADPHPLLVSLAEKKRKVKEHFETRHAAAHIWLAERGLTLDTLREHSGKILTGATLGSALLLGSPQIPVFSASSPNSHHVYNDVSQFSAKLNSLDDTQLTAEVEEEVTQNVQDLYGLSTSFSLDQHRLPQYIGLMGLEQHLYRYAGDSLSNHAQYQEAGIAPARGAFGYFAETGKSQEEMVLQEEYYIVLQTFLIPEWNSDWVHLKEWYKFRKFLVINPENGKAVVAVLGDSGPAVWTGKQFGGSPEVMAGLGWYPKKTKGKMILLFLDDPGNTVPLGPVQGGSI